MPEVEQEVDEFLQQQSEHPEMQGIMQQDYASIPMPGDFNEAWIKYIIEFHLPKDLERILILYLKPLVDLAAKSNILRKEIPMHLLQYDLIWDMYRMYEQKGKYDSRLMVCQEIIRHALELQLNRSVKGWQGELIFTKRFDIRNRNKEKDTGWRGLFKKKNEEEEE